jgi:hypothetical protein
MGGPLNPTVGNDGLPKMGSTIEGEARVYANDDVHKQLKGVRVEKDSDDDLNTGKTYSLRPGLVLLRAIAGVTGKWVDESHPNAPADGDIVECGILDHYLDMRDDTAAAREDKVANVMVHGRVLTSQVIFGNANAARIAAIKAAMKNVIFEEEP